MEIMMYVFIFIIGLGLGWSFAIYKFAKDPSIIHLKPDEVIYKRPPEDTVMVAVTPDVARKLVYNKDPNTTEGFSQRAMLNKLQKDLANQE